MKSTIYRWKNIIILATIVQVLPTMGCEVTSEKIARWKQSEKGPPKIRAALRDSKQKITIRVEAAEALAELGFFLPMAEDMKALTARDRQQITEELSKRLLQKMKGANPKATSRVQIQAKDALFSLRDLVDPSLHQLIDAELVKWLLGDWRSRQIGEHGGDKVITSIGAPAGPFLASSLSENPMLVVALASLLRKVGDQQARDAGAEKLVALAEKQKPPQMPTFHALGKVGSEKAVHYLATIAQKGDIDPRLWALRALALFPHPSVIPIAKTIAADTTLTGDDAILRDEAFTVLEKIEDPQSLAVLSTFLADKNDQVRYRAAEAMLSGFGEQGLSKLLETLPSSYTYKKQDVIDFLEEDIIKSVEEKALGPLRASLESKNWIARLIAVRVLGRIGKKDDVAALTKLANDNTVIRGWGTTIGSEAKTAAEKLEHSK